MDEPLVAVRIKDGIFVGNMTAAHDDDFLMTNKISHVLNCAGNEVKDLYGNAGVHYLTFHWKDQAALQGLVTPTGVMFDAQDHNIEQCVRFLDQGMAEGECVLVHDVHGTSRACALVAGYIVAKYGWKLDNALAFMQMAHQEMEIRPHWMKQLKAFSRRHDVDIDIFDPEVDDRRFSLDNDQWMLRNTLLNGLTANVQDSNALYQQCAKDAPPLEQVAKAQGRRRKRIVFADTNQGTHVDSYSTTPVVHPKAAHIDPAVGPTFSGSKGLTSLFDGKRMPIESIVARRSPVNVRRLESTIDVNAKGRQQLFKRYKAEIGGHHHNGLLGDKSATAQPTAPNTTLQRINSLTARGELQAPEMSQRNPTPTTSTTTPLRPATTIQRHAPSVTAANTISHSIGSTVPLQRAQSPMDRRDSGAGESSYMASGAPMKGTNIAAPAKAPVRGTNGTIRSPFSIGSSGVGARKGSPLPRQQTAANGQAAPVARREVVSSGYGYGAITPNRTSRPSSPAPQPSGVATSRYGPSTGISSPFVQRGTTQSRPQSPTQLRANASTASTGAGSSTTVRRALSPRPSGQFIGAGASSSVISGSAGASAIQPTIRRANSPTARTRIGSGVSNFMPGFPTAPAAPTSGSRPPSPMQRAPTANGPTASQLGVRPNSPSRRASGGSLAEQYLVGQHPPSATGTNGGGISRGMAATTAGSQVAFGSAVRRNSPTTVTRRY